MLSGSPSLPWPSLAHVPIDGMAHECRERTVTVLLHPTPHRTAGGTAPAAMLGSPCAELELPVSPREGMSLLADRPLGSVVVVTGGVLISARVQDVRRGPSGAAITLVGRCPQRLEAASGSVLVREVVSGPLGLVSLRWAAGGTITSTRLPDDVSVGDVIVVFSRRVTGASARHHWGQGAARATW